MKKIIAVLILCTLLIAGLATQYSLLLTRYARFFSVNNPTKGADALVVLSGGIISRLPHAIKLFRQGYAPQILLTEAQHQNPQLRHICGDERDIAMDIMQTVKVKVNLAVVPSLKNGATSTFDEAYDVRQFSLEHGFRHLIIVTNTSHTRRALYAFKKIFKGSDIIVEAAGAKNDIFNETNWWQTDLGIEAYIMEPIKYVIYSITKQNVAFIDNY